MPIDTTTTREENARQTGKSDRPERERNVETGREAGARRSMLPYRTPYFGTTNTPFGLMRRMAEDIERLFTDADYARVGYGLTSPYRGTSDLDSWRSGNALADVAWSPQVETFRRDGNIVIRADLPGLTKENISIDVDNEVLTIAGERSDEFKRDEDGFYRTERSYGRFHRAIALPDGVNADDIDATFKDGVLEVTIPAPKAKAARGRQVKIR